MAQITKPEVQQVISDSGNLDSVAPSLKDKFELKVLYDILGQLTSGTVTTGFGNSPLFNLDAGSRLRVSEPYTLFESQFQYDLSPLLWDVITTGIGTSSATHLPNESAVSLSVNSTNGAGIKLRTRRYYRYQPGKGNLVQMTFLFGSPVANLIRSIGQYDDNGGIMFVQKGIIGNFVRIRSSTSGSVVDTREVIQSQWNIDTLDGSGSSSNPSGLSIDTSKVQFLVLDYQWFSVGVVRIGFKIEGRIIYVHKFLTTNTLTTPFCETMNKPLTYEVFNSGATSGTNTLKAICSAIISEGGSEQRGYLFSGGTGVSPKTIAAGSIQPMYAIRPKLTFNSIVNRGLATIHSISISSDKDVYYRMSHFKSRSTITGGSWVDVQATNSILEINTTLTAEGTPDVIKEQDVVTATNQNASNLLSPVQRDRLPMSLNAAGNDSDVIVISAQNLGTGSAIVSSHVRWGEER